MTSKICLVGDIVIDVSLKTSENDLKMRLGGIVHSARSLWAQNVPFSVAYFAPAYLDEQIVEYLNSLGCEEIYKLGNVIGSPYVFLIEEIKEVGNQGYDFLLRDEITIEYDTIVLNKLFSSNYDDFLITSGNFRLAKVINSLKGNVHLDIANSFQDIKNLNELQRKVKTIFVSTSSPLFSSSFKSDFQQFSDLFNNFCEILVLKENRGGSRAMDLETKNVYNITSQTRTIVHSVGVGDAYNAAFVLHYSQYSYENALNISSWIACEYASTTFPDDFKLNVQRIMNLRIEELAAISGIFLPWEKRNLVNIYIAAPDFSFIDTSHVDILCNALKYHNFSPRRPIAENGEMEPNASRARKLELFSKDVELLNNCSILVAVLLYDDPGTLIEIGLASAKGIPTIVYDPYNRATNCMLTELPNLISQDLDEIICEIFKQSEILTY